MKKAANRGFDLHGVEIGRTLAQAARSACLPFRNADFGGGPGFGLTARLLAWHLAGRAVCAALVRWEAPARRFLTRSAGVARAMCGGRQ